jgi:hypothetical protein
MFENIVLMRIFGTRKDKKRQGDRENCIVRKAIIYNLHRTLLG